MKTTQPISSALAQKRSERCRSSNSMPVDRGRYLNAAHAELARAVIRAVRWQARGVAVRRCRALQAYRSIWRTPRRSLSLVTDLRSGAQDRDPPSSSAAANWDSLPECRYPISSHVTQALLHRGQLQKDGGEHGRRVVFRGSRAHRAAPRLGLRLLLGSILYQRVHLGHKRMSYGHRPSMSGSGCGLQDRICQGNRPPESPSGRYDIDAGPWPDIPQWCTVDRQRLRSLPATAAILDAEGIQF
jgi:hypothetical protein